MASNVVINASNLTLSYGDTEIIKDANFSVKKGEFVFITGPAEVENQHFSKHFMGRSNPVKGV